MAFNPNQKFDSSILHQNAYLEDPEKGLQLIASLLGGNADSDSIIIDNVVDDLVASCGQLDLPANNESLAKIRQIVSLLKQPARNKLLSGYAIIGVGGQFSAGKSSVLNSLLGTDTDYKLPEDTSATTSISTYIMHRAENKATACTAWGKEVNLDKDALEALSHKFRDQYKLNPAQYLDFITISQSDFPVDGVALLDTPGYNASDNATKQEYKDRDRSSKALKSVDHLIWLVSAKEPLISKTDIGFLRELSIKAKMTVIVNKCDLVPDIYQEAHPENSKPIQNILNDLKKYQLPCDTLILYNARKPEWNDGKNKLLTLLQNIAKSKKQTENRVTQLSNEIGKLKEAFQQQIEQRNSEKIAKIDNSISNALNTFQQGALVRMRGILKLEQFNLQHDGTMFNRHADQILNWATKQSK